MARLLGFSDLAERARDNGFVPVPVAGKKPLIKHWNGRELRDRALKNLVSTEGMQGAGVAFRTGKLVVVDIDQDDADAAWRTQQIVVGALGATPFVRVGKPPRRALFYRSAVEVPSQQLGATEILGLNKLVTVWGIHPDTHEPYLWPDECLLDHPFQHVPLIVGLEFQYCIRQLEIENDRDQALSTLQVIRRRQSANMVLDKEVRLLHKRQNSGAHILFSPVRSGDRNKTLFQLVKNKARSYRRKEDLFTLALAINDSFSPPLSDKEVAQIVESVWKYKTAGTLIVAGQQQILLPLTKDNVRKLTAEAVQLLALLQSTRSKPPFEIPQKATAKHLGWGSNRVKKAIDDLIAYGILKRITPRCRRDPIRYHL